MTWHADQPLIDQYASGTLGEARAASIEAHLLSCSTCRSLVGTAVPADALDAIWAATEQRIDRPRRTWFELVAGLFGVPSHLARVVGLTPALRVSWLLAVGFVTALGVLAARGDAGPGVFLLAAPLVPMAGVAAAYAPGFDPSHEMVTVTVTGGLRLLLYRVIAVAATSFGLLAVGSVALPELGAGAAAAWVLPALALAAVTLAAGSRFDPLHAAIGLGLGWFLVVESLVLLDAIQISTHTVTIGAPVQVGAALVLVVSTAVFTARARVVELPER